MKSKYKPIYNRLNNILETHIAFGLGTVILISIKDLQQRRPKP